MLALLLLVLQSKFWLGAGGWREARELQDSVSAQREENARLQQRNDALSAEVEDLKSGETAVEERARSELGMIKPGETFYRVVEPHAVRAPDDAPAAAGAGAAADGQSGGERRRSAVAGRPCRGRCPDAWTLTPWFDRGNTRSRERSG